MQKALVAVIALLAAVVIGCSAQAPVDISALTANDSLALAQAYARGLAANQNRQASLGQSWRVVEIRPYFSGSGAADVVYSVVVGTDAGWLGSPADKQAVIVGLAHAPDGTWRVKNSGEMPP